MPLHKYVGKSFDPLHIFILHVNIIMNNINVQIVCFPYSEYRQPLKWLLPEQDHTQTVSKSKMRIAILNSQMNSLDSFGYSNFDLHRLFSSQF